MSCFPGDPAISAPGWGSSVLRGMAYCFWPSIMTKTGPWVSLGPANHRNYGQLKGDAAALVELRATEAALELYGCSFPFCGPTGRQKHASSAQGHVQMLCVRWGWLSFGQNPQFPPAASLKHPQGPLMPAFIQWSVLASCYKLLSLHTSSVLHTDLWRVEPGDLERGREPMSTTLSLWLSQLISAAASLDVVCLSPHQLPCRDDFGRNQSFSFIFPGKRRDADPLLLRGCGQIVPEAKKKNPPKSKLILQVPKPSTALSSRSCPLRL